MTPLEAIRKKCVEDCCAGSKFEVRQCNCPSCPLFEFRFGKNPYLTRKTNPEICEKMRIAKKNKQQQ